MSCDLYLDVDVDKVAGRRSFCYIRFMVMIRSGDLNCMLYDVYS